MALPCLLGGAMSTLPKKKPEITKDQIIHNLLTAGVALPMLGHITIFSIIFANRALAKGVQQ